MTQREKLIFKRAVIICDFCSSEDVRWSYDCPDFQAPLLSSEPWISTQGWAACDTCHDFIEADDWDGLRAHATRRYFVVHPSTPNTPRVRSMIDSDLRVIYALFSKLKTGVEKYEPN